MVSPTCIFHCTLGAFWADFAPNVRWFLHISNTIDFKGLRNTPGAQKKSPANAELLFVGKTGLEPATPRPPDACANQLRHFPKADRKVS